MANLKLVLGVLTISSLAVFGNGFNFEELRPKREAKLNHQREFQEVSTENPGNNGGPNCRFPKEAFRCDCCTMPDEILGNLTGSFKTCFGKRWEEYNKNKNQRYGGKYQHSQRQEIDDGEIDPTPETSNPGDDSGEVPTFRPPGDGSEDPERPEGRPDGPGGSPDGPGGRPDGPPGGRPDGPPGGRPDGPGGRPGGPEGRPGGPGGRGPRGPGRGPGGRGPPDGQGPDCDKGGRRRGLSDFFKDIFQKIVDFFKNIIEKITDLLADHFGGRQRDGCLMECVFEKENWLEDGKVNVEEIRRRIEGSKTSQNSKWIQVALEAVDDCSRSAKAEEGKKCQSGSEEFFMCMGRRIFINCPEFKDEYEECKALRNFYDKCPATHPVPLKCHQHGPARGNGEEPPMRYRKGDKDEHQRYHNHH